MLEKEKRPVVNAGKPGPKAAIISKIVVLIVDFFCLLFPFNPEWRVGEHVIKLFPFESVVFEGATQFDIVCLFPLDEHIGPADGPGVIIPVLPKQV